MMDMNEILPDFAITGLKVEPAYDTVVTMMAQASLACLRIAFVGVHAYLFLGPFNVLLARFKFIGEQPLPNSDMSGNCLAILAKTFLGCGKFCCAE